MYLIIWEYVVKEGREQEFLQAYRPGGKWTELFQLIDGFLGMELLHDGENPDRYLTIDRWASAAAFEEFKAHWAKEYQELDSHCHEFLVCEALIGVYTVSG